MSSKINPKTLTVGVLGYTGETGKALTHQLFQTNIFKDAVLIGRRKIDYKEEYLKNSTQKQVDFEKLSDFEETFKNIDVVYCCLGTTRGKAGKDGFRRVDYDYVYEAAKLAKKNGCKEFHLVTSQGANKNSMFLYPQVKGEIEEAVSKFDFDKCVIYRPAVLMCDREERRVAESIFRTLIKPIQYLAPTLMTTPTETLAKAMINNTYLVNDRPKLEIIENVKIFELANLK